MESKHYDSKGLVKKLMGFLRGVYSVKLVEEPLRGFPPPNVNPQVFPLPNPELTPFLRRLLYVEDVKKVISWSTRARGEFSQDWFSPLLGRCSYRESLEGERDGGEEFEASLSLDSRVSLVQQLPSATLPGVFETNRIDCNYLGSLTARFIVELYESDARSVTESCRVKISSEANFSTKRGDNYAIVDGEHKFTVFLDGGDGEFMRLDSVYRVSFPVSKDYAYDLPFSQASGFRRGVSKEDTRVWFNDKVVEGKDIGEEKWAQHVRPFLETLLSFLITRGYFRGTVAYELRVDSERVDPSQYYCNFVSKSFERNKEALFSHLEKAEEMVESEDGMGEEEVYGMTEALHQLMFFGNDFLPSVGCGKAYKLWKTWGLDERVDRLLRKLGDKLGEAPFQKRDKGGSKGDPMFG